MSLRKRALKEMLNEIKDLSYPYIARGIDKCPMCNAEVCKFTDKCDLTLSACIDYFTEKAREEGKYYWDVVREHIKNELKKLEKLEGGRQ